MDRRVEQIRILLVEDSMAEARLTEEALMESGVAHELFTVHDGEAATSFLRRGKGFRGALRPDLVFLDLNLPRKDGREVLRDMKEDPLLAMIPVIVITNSQAQEDIDQVYRLKANCYLVKPPRLDDFFHMVNKVVDFWWMTAQLPGAPEALLYPEDSSEYVV